MSNFVSSLLSNINGGFSNDGKFEKVRDLGSYLSQNSATVILKNWHGTFLKPDFENLRIDYSNEPSEWVITRSLSDSKGFNISSRAGNKVLYWRVDCSSNDVVGLTENCSSWEVFTFERSVIDATKFGIRSSASGHFVSTEKADGNKKVHLVANRVEAREWESIEFLVPSFGSLYHKLGGITSLSYQTSSNTVSVVMKNWHGTYLKPDFEGLRLDYSTDPYAWTIKSSPVAGLNAFTISAAKDNKVYYWRVDCGAQDLVGLTLNCAEWEAFTFEKSAIDPSKIGIKSNASKHYVSTEKADGNKKIKVVADRAEPREWESMEFFVPSRIRKLDGISNLNFLLNQDSTNILIKNYHGTFLKPNFDAMKIDYSNDPFEWTVKRTPLNGANGFVIFAEKDKKSFYWSVRLNANDLVELTESCAQWEIFHFEKSAINSSLFGIRSDASKHFVSTEKPDGNKRVKIVADRVEPREWESLEFFAPFDAAPRYNRINGLISLDYFIAQNNFSAVFKNAHGSFLRPNFEAQKFVYSTEPYEWLLKRSDLIDAQGFNIYAINNGKNYYWRVDLKSNDLLGLSETASYWEVFNFEKSAIDTSKFGIKSFASKHFVCAEREDGNKSVKVVADRTEAREWESFEVFAVNINSESSTASPSSSKDLSNLNEWHMVNSVGVAPI